MPPTGPSEPCTCSLGLDPSCELHGEDATRRAAQAEREGRWIDIAQRNLGPNREALNKISVQDYRAAGVAMANGVIDKRGDIAVEASAAQLLWDCTPKTADPAFIELIGGYRDTLVEFQERGSDV